ncbi:MAG: galactokinase [Treponema sp.]|jgi:galactokinase|nr:galactokinase [Treponema sp.]
MTGQKLLDRLNSAGAAAVFEKLYGESGVETARLRYAALVRGILDDSPDGFPRSQFPETAGEMRLFTAAGRTELGGNHTDHNLGKVLAASIQMDQAAVVCPRNDNIVFYRSEGYPDVRVDLSDLSARENEKGATEALVRGIAAEFAARGIRLKGFSANAASTVLSGSGLSSSAAVEVLFGRIFDALYGGGKLSALEIAQMGQKAENLYFGKPCGLMDQTACASGGAVAIDFGDAAHPVVTNIGFDLEEAGWTLCVVNTRGNHADLTPDYAAIPHEMKAAAAFFGKTVLREVDRKQVVARAAGLRKAAGDRALLRALHFFDENDRVDAMTAALEDMNRAILPGDKQKALACYLDLVNESGDSSWELLQNVYAPRNPAEQGISTALALTRNFFRSRSCKPGGGDRFASGGASVCGPVAAGACRVHGGGFAGTIQAYLPLGELEAYRQEMEEVFGADSVTVLRIRPVGAAELAL